MITFKINDIMQILVITIIIIVTIILEVEMINIDSKGFENSQTIDEVNLQDLLCDLVTGEVFKGCDRNVVSTSVTQTV